MSTFHAAVWLGHTSARVLSFKRMSGRFDPTRYRAVEYRVVGEPGSSETERALYDELCDAIRDVPEVLVTGLET